MWNTEKFENIKNKMWKIGTSLGHPNKMWRLRLNDFWNIVGLKKSIISEIRMTNIRYKESLSKTKEGEV